MSDHARAIAPPPAQGGSMSTPDAPPVRRSKVCLLGSSLGGKTSLVKSITDATPVLVAEADRTIGIELYSYRFTDADGQDHEVVFWDFAGQDVYQVANALFFSSRTLYLLCVDLDEYAKGLTSAQEGASDWDHDAATQRFVEQQVFRWARLIFARQPDAHLVVVGTKSDLLAGNPKLLTRINADLELRIEGWCTDFARRLEKTNPLRKRARQFSLHQSMVVSVTTAEGVQHAKQELERRITDNKALGLRMTPPYVRILAALRKRRDSTTDLDTLGRMQKLIRRLSTIEADLSADCDGSDARNELHTILRDFHDQGEILWYEQENAGPFKDVVILDPSVVLDIVRELINHNYQDDSGEAFEALRDRGEVKHSLLMTFDTWRSVYEADKDLVCMFKMLMEFYQLAYPVGDQEMVANSDLIVPTYWKSKKQASITSLVPRGESMLRRPQLERSFSGYWQYAVPAELSEPIFDQFIVQSHTNLFTRLVTANFVETKVEGKFVARIFFETGTDITDHIRIEVVAASDAICWKVVRFFVVAMEIVLEGYPGLNDVSRDILHRDSAGNSEEKSYSLPFAIQDFDDARRLGLGVGHPRKERPWLPPNLDWFVAKVWQNPNVLAEMEETERKRQVDMFNAVTKKLAATSDKRRTLPALFTVRFAKQQPSAVQVQLLSDLSGVCYHTPIQVSMTPSLWNKVSSLIPDGVSVFATVPKTCLSQQIVDEVLEMGRTGLIGPAELEQPVHNMVDKFPSATQRQQPDLTAAGLLRDLLRPRDLAQEIGIMENSGLRCGATASGEYVWASQQELDEAGGFSLRNPDNIRREVEAFKQASLTPVISRATTIRQKYFIEITGASSVPEEDRPGVFCSWEIARSGQSALELGSTAPVSKQPGVKQDPADHVTWNAKFALKNIPNLAVLRECQLVVKMKRPRRWFGAVKTICQGTLKLGQILGDDKNHSTQFKVNMDGAPGASILVHGVLTIDERETSSQGA